MLSDVKDNEGIAESETIYDNQITRLINACYLDMTDSGVMAPLIPVSDNATADFLVTTAVCLYVHAYRVDDPDETEKYLNSYRYIVSRLALKEA